MKSKSLFITLFPAFGTISFVISLIELKKQGLSLQLAGALLCSGIISGLFVLVYSSKRSKKAALAISRKNQNLPCLSLGIGLGIFLTLVGFYKEEKDYFIGGLALVNAINWVMYIGWYSKFPSRQTNTIIKEGQFLPDFELEDFHKNTFHSKALIGSPVVFIFYRGNWCPLCMAQIKEVAKQYQELEKRGVKTVLVSPQPHKHTALLAKKFDVGYYFMVDKNNKAAEQLGITDRGALPLGFQALGYASDLVMPTVIITDRTGKILFVHLTDNYRVRPEPGLFINVLDGETI